MTCAISGAVGTFANVDPAGRGRRSRQGSASSREPVSTQVIPRDRHAAFFAALALVACGIERLATEIRHLQRTEVGEAEEPFAAARRAARRCRTSATRCCRENLTGLARLMRGRVVPALENVALWHERDISHSSVERVMLPDACIVPTSRCTG